MHTEAWEPLIYCDLLKLFCLNTSFPERIKILNMKIMTKYQLNQLYSRSDSVCILRNDWAKITVHLWNRTIRWTADGINKSLRVTCVSKTEHIQTNLFYPKTNPSNTTMIHISHKLQPAVKWNSGHYYCFSSGKWIDNRNLALEIWHLKFAAAVNTQTFSLRFI